MNEQLPTLYIRDSKGKARQWSVRVEGNAVIVTHGIVGGKLQEKVTYAKPKNTGKANETTAEQQAWLEAKSKWTKQKEREDYHEDIEQAGKQLRPMLALDYTKVPHRVNWDEAIVQPKLDGLRLTVGNRHIVNGYTPGQIEMLTRKGETYELPHLEEASHELLSIINKYTSNKCVALDGEAYIHGMPLQNIVSLARKYQRGKTEQLEYHVFDLVIPDMPFVDRHEILREAVYKLGHDKFKHVSVYPVTNHDDLLERHGFFVEQGYEGAMIRHKFSPYEVGQRSAHLFKFKQFHDKECIVVDVWKDNNGNAMLTCFWDKNDPKTAFGCTPKRTHEERKMMLLNRGKIIGKWIKVKYQALTEDGLPQFPVGLEFRDCDESGNPLF